MQSQSFQTNQLHVVHLTTHLSGVKKVLNKCTLKEYTIHKHCTSRSSSVRKWTHHIGPWLGVAHHIGRQKVDHCLGNACAEVGKY